ncbi:MAG: DUF4388 domain-containing protein [Chloroflexi bacterium]|nr:DUF4388 domain-containing protein [Anaerolineaceae bacterium]NMB88360.1 DUF4388 domain-containing protein [Chloroflexota bacterium]
MQGNLHDMAVADLIQHNCQERKTARLQLQHAGQQAVFFFKDGKVVHATSGNQAGEEAVYQVLDWNEGTFSLETGVETPAVTISRSWSGLLLEGARRLDERNLGMDVPETDLTIGAESDPMTQRIDDLLKAMSAEVTGYIASAVVGMDGIHIAHHELNKVNADTISAQLTLLLKLVDTSSNKLGTGVVEDNLTTTENAYIMMRFLPDKQHFLGVVVDHKIGSLGNMRLLSKIYIERIAGAMPH